MGHRHLNHQRYTLAAIDDIISRGKKEDWAELREELRHNPALADKIRRVCKPKISDPYAQRYHFWYDYAGEAPQPTSP